MSDSLEYIMIVGPAAALAAAVTGCPSERAITAARAAIDPLVGRVEMTVENVVEVHLAIVEACR